MPTNLDVRFKTFSIDTIKMLKGYHSSAEMNVIKHQLIKSATSIGANYEEAQGASSKKDFLFKIRICLKEARETNYWLGILQGLEENEEKNLNKIIQESVEIRKILISICKKAST